MPQINYYTNKKPSNNSNQIHNTIAKINVLCGKHHAVRYKKYLTLNTQEIFLRAPDTKCFGWVQYMQVTGKSNFLKAAVFTVPNQPF